jgi:hypothetical protein
MARASYSSQMVLNEHRRLECTIVWFYLPIRAPELTLASTA